MYFFYNKLIIYKNKIPYLFIDINDISGPLVSILIRSKLDNIYYSSMNCIHFIFLTCQETTQMYSYSIIVLYCIFIIYFTRLILHKSNQLVLKNYFKLKYIY